MVYLDVSNFSHYPAERERLIFGGSLGFLDVIYNGSSHAEAVMSLTLYQQIIAGKWFSDKSNVFFRKKYERRIMKMMSNMIHLDRAHHHYMQQLFECITKFMKSPKSETATTNNDRSPPSPSSNGQRQDDRIKTLWINKKECESLIPELCKLISDQFVSYLLQHQIRIKYAFSMEMNPTVQHINDSSFKKSLYSKRYKFQCSVQGDTCSLHFRCYKKYDSHKEEDMFRGFIATQNKLPKTVSRIELKYGLHFSQLGWTKWDSCTLSKSQLYKGSSLFKMGRVQDFETLNIKISFQVRAIYDQDGKRWEESG